MTIQTDLDDAFAEVGAQVKTRVVGLNGTKSIWTGTRAEFEALPSQEAGVLYFVLPNPTP